MKRRINFEDEQGHKTTREFEVPEKDHLLAQQRFPARVYKNKKKEVPSKYVHCDILDPETGAIIGHGTMSVGTINVEVNDEDRYDEEE